MRNLKIKYFIFSFLLTVSSAFADSSEKIFCENPFAVVCGDVHQLEQNYDQLRNYFLKSALAKIQRQYPSVTMDDQGLDLRSVPESVQEITAQKFSDAVDEFYTRLLQQKKISIGPNDIKEIIAPIITESAKYYADSNIMNNLKNVSIAFTRSQFVKVSQHYISSKSTYSNSMNAYQKTCGTLTPNAVFDPYENTLIICPGLVLRTMSGSSSVDAFSKESLLKYLTFIIGHEFSHSLDQYMHLGNFYQCLKTDASYGSIEFNMIEKKRETYADFWAYKALSKTLEKQKNFDVKVALLKNSLHALCLYETVGSHPTSKFRINTLLNYPDVADQFGCTSNVKPQCK